MLSFYEGVGVASFKNRGVGVGAFVFRLHSPGYSACRFEIFQAVVRISMLFYEIDVGWSSLLCYLSMDLNAMDCLTHSSKYVTILRKCRGFSFSERRLFIHWSSRKCSRTLCLTQITLRQWCCLKFVTADDERFRTERRQCGLLNRFEY
jgi:hypothetical protein